MRFEFVHAPLTRPFAGLGHFHASGIATWHPCRGSVPRLADVGDHGTRPVLRRDAARLEPRGGWWGEGDEKFFVDGERFPSTIGTGSEDYFGYAWCDPGLFEYAYHCQSMTEGNRGHQSVLRWHITDNIPFQTSFEACIEKYYGTTWAR